MKENLHPDYHEVTVVCACGETFKTGSTKKGEEIKIDICNKCHPYFTGAQKIVDAGGRVEKFNKRYGNINKQLYILGASFSGLHFFVCKFTRSLWAKSKFAHFLFYVSFLNV